jgi:hypothetical protein
VTATRCGSTRVGEMSKETYSNTRVEPTAPKVAPAAREPNSPGSADPTTVSVCAVDAENVDVVVPKGTAKSGERSHGYSVPAPPFDE